MAEPTPQRVRHLAIACGALALLFVGLWCAVQGGLMPAPGTLPAVSGKVAAVVYLILSSMPYVLSLWLGAAGWGLLVRNTLARDARNGVVIQLASGLGVMLMLDWLLALFGLLNAWTAWGVCAAGFFILTSRISTTVKQLLTRPEQWPSPPWTLLLGLPALGLLLTACACPPGTVWPVEAFGYDVMTYHLQVPSEWIDAGHMAGLEHNVYSHLPLLVEAGYMQVGLMVGDIHGAVYIVQFFHATTALLAAAAVAGIVRRYVGAAAGVIAGVFLHAAPWVIITGSLAYNECFVLALGGAALLLALDSASDNWRGAALVGLLLGFATLAKLTAGPMIALPVVVIMATRLHRSAQWKDAVDWRTSLRSSGVVALFTVLTVAPWLARNAAWTGNPVFPMATGVFGQGHWDDELAQRWDAAHDSDGVGQGLGAIGRQWLWNKAYGAAWGVSTQNTPGGGVAQFDTSGGLPVLWLVALLGVVLGLAWSAGRRITGAMLVMLGVQVVFWVVATHHQSRFIIPTLLPGCVLVGIGFGRLEHVLRGKVKPWVFACIAGAPVLVLTSVSFDTFYQQSPKAVVNEGSNQLVLFAPWFAVDARRELTPEERTASNPQDLLWSVPGDHVLNHLPGDARVYIVADNMRLFDIRGTVPDRFVYHTPFDRSPLGDLFREHAGDARAVARDLREAGFTHLWVGHSELGRLSAKGNYGYDEDVVKHIRALMSLCPVVRPYGRAGRPVASLCRLPDFE